MLLPGFYFNNQNMPKKAIILDLDNTIYPVHSIGDELFAPLFTLITQSNNHTNNIGPIKDDIMRKPFQVVAKEYQFDNQLINECMSLLQNLIYESEILPFSDYNLVKNSPLEKFLVTTGFTNLQQSKIRQLSIQQDFKEIHIVDPTTSNRTKKDVFKEIIERFNYAEEDV